jgi:hypothetical protein
LLLRTFSNTGSRRGFRIGRSVGQVELDAWKSLSLVCCVGHDEGNCVTFSVFRSRDQKDAERLEGEIRHYEGVKKCLWRVLHVLTGLNAGLLAVEVHAERRVVVNCNGEI